MAPLATISSRFARTLGGLLARLRPDRPRAQVRRPPTDDVAQEASASLADGHDVIVIGAGICGVRFLRRARENGLRCVAIEKQADVGGLWRWLPAWQDIQNRREDFDVEELSLAGVKQADVVELVRGWVDRHDLAPSIELGCEVTSVARVDGSWEVSTSSGTQRGKHLVVASGAQNRPWIPEVERSAPDVVERHSSELRRPEDLTGQRVTIVGGGASAWDLLDLALDHHAAEIRWVYRNPRWFLPTARAKQRAWPNIRELAVVQSLVRTDDTLSAFLQGLLRAEYDRFGLPDLEPSEPFDVREHMVIPGRARLLRGLDDLDRHHSAIRGISGREVLLDNGDRFETDVVLWGTGYRMDLQYLGLPEYDHVHSGEELLPKLGSLVRSRDYPNLFFLGMTLLDSTSATPFFAEVETKSIIAHIQERCVIPIEPVPHQINHWDLFEHFAAFDRANYPQVWWRIKYFLLACWYVARPRRPVSVS